MKSLKEIWNDPRKIEEGEWYMLIAVFIAVWMMMFMRYWN